jgi:hypothetical protein
MVHHSRREIHCKVVYYGPGLGGKTTNLRRVHERAPDSAKGRMVSIATENERTLFFDFMPLNLGTIRGYKVRFHLYTVPGQGFYAASRRLILRGVDGLIFVADSQAARYRENLDSLDDLYRNLHSHGIEADAVPLVMQWNKRDLLDALPVWELERALNPDGLPSFEAVALHGNGVFETLKCCCKAVLRRFEERQSVSPPALRSVARR